MGTFRVTVEVGDPSGTRWQPIEMMVDTGATFTWVPAPILRELGIQPEDQLTFTIANGEEIQRGVAETQVRYQDRTAHTFVVFGDDASSPLLGAYTLEGFMLAVDSYHRRLVQLRAFALSAEAPVERKL